MAFSGALQLTDLNDFITPSQTCIKPVEQSNAQAAKDHKDTTAASTQIRIDSSGSYYELSSSGASGSTPAPRKLETAQISLNDCLACSGCITSAESVLITMQSHEEVFSVLARNPPSICIDHKTTVLSISPQSLASLAATISPSTGTITLKHVLHRVTAFGRKLGFEHVYDTTFARHLALLEHAREFHERCEQRHETSDGDDNAGKLPMLASACPGWVCYAEKTHPEMLPFISRTKSPQQVMGTLVKKWLSQKWGKKPDKIYHVTVMPCYDKKLEASREDFFDADYATRDVDCVITTGELELMMRERGWDVSGPFQSDEIDGSPTKIAFESSEGGAMDASDDQHTNPIGPGFTFPTLLTHPGTSSGSYLHTLIAQIRTSHPDAELTTRQIRGQDYEEYVLRAAESGKILFKGARCYGFRNLQNVVRRVGRGAGVRVGRGAAGRLDAAAVANGAVDGGPRVGAMRAKIKARAARQNRGKKDENTRVNGSTNVANGNGVQEDEEDRPYDYVEIMACPGGCVNGGGQLKPVSLDPSSTTTTATTNGIENGNAGTEKPDSELRWGTRAWTRRVEEAYWHDLPTPPPSPRLSLSPNASVNNPNIESHSSSQTHSRSPSQLQPHPTTLTHADADALAFQILSDLCLPDPSTPTYPLPTSWTEPLPNRAESLRRSYFRTSYRAVVSEVSGIQVQW